MKLTNLENKMMFEIALLAYEECGRWMSQLEDDNYSCFLGKELVERLSWSKEKVGGVMTSLTEKNLIYKEDQANELGQKLNWINIYENGALSLLKEWEKQYPDYCENPF